MNYSHESGQIDKQVYKSTGLYGFKFSGSYSLAGVRGNVSQGSSWAAAIQYARGSVGRAVGFSRINNSTTSNAGAAADVSEVTNG